LGTQKVSKWRELPGLVALWRRGGTQKVCLWDPRNNHCRHAPPSSREEYLGREPLLKGRTGAGIRLGMGKRGCLNLMLSFLGLPREILAFRTHFEIHFLEVLGDEGDE